MIINFRGSKAQKFGPAPAPAKRTEVVEIVFSGPQFRCIGCCVGNKFDLKKSSKTFRRNFRFSLSNEIRSQEFFGQDGFEPRRRFEILQQSSGNLNPPQVIVSPCVTRGGFFKKQSYGIALAGHKS